MGKYKLASAGVVVVMLVIGLNATLFTVHQTEQALVLQFGNPIRVVREPGLTWKIPFVQNIEYYERRVLNLDPPPQEVILVDQKRINVDAFARYQITDPLEFRKKALTSANFLQIFGGLLNASVRDKVGKVFLVDMLTEKRTAVMTQITAQMKAKAPEFGVEVIDIRIGRTDLPVATSQSVYNRMQSDRKAYAAQIRAEGEEQKLQITAKADKERTILLAEAQKQSQILRGQGDALRTRILNDAYNEDPKFFAFYRSLEAYGIALGSDTTLVLSPDSDFFRFFGDRSGLKE